MNSILILIIDFWYKFLLHLHQKPEPFSPGKKEKTDIKCHSLLNASQV